MSVNEHRIAANSKVAKVHLFSVSSTRQLDNDTAGKIGHDLLLAAGHQVTGREVIEDDFAVIQAKVVERIAARDVHAILLTGGTGISRCDVTPDAIEMLFEKRLPGFGELFRMLSFQQVGTAAWLSRATAGIIGQVLVASLPGSEAGFRLGLEKVLLPELAHVLSQLEKQPKKLQYSI